MNRSARRLVWFKKHWLPTFDTDQGITGLSTRTQQKIDIQAAGTYRKVK